MDSTSRYIKSKKRSGGGTTIVLCLMHCGTQHPSGGSYSGILEHLAFGTLRRTLKPIGLKSYLWASPTPGSSTGATEAGITPFI